MAFSRIIIFDQLLTTSMPFQNCKFLTPYYTSHIIKISLTSNDIATLIPSQRYETELDFYIKEERGLFPEYSHFQKLTLEIVQELSDVFTGAVCSVSTMNV